MQPICFVTTPKAAPLGKWQCVCGGQLSGGKNENCLSWPCHQTRWFCTFSFPCSRDVPFAKMSVWFHQSASSAWSHPWELQLVKNTSFFPHTLLAWIWWVFFGPSLLKEGFRINQIFDFSPAIKNFGAAVVLCSKGWSCRSLRWLQQYFYCILSHRAVLCHINYWRFLLQI